MEARERRTRRKDTVYMWCEMKGNSRREKSESSTVEKEGREGPYSRDEEKRVNGIECKGT